MFMEGRELKVIGLAGSPRRGGNTDLLLAEVLKGAASKGANIKLITINNLKLSPCQHCDSCQILGRCRIEDDMQLIYRELEEADRIVIASPIHFLGLSAQMKICIDRCQALWARKYRLKVPPLGTEKARKGFFISVGGTRVKNLFDGAIATIKTLFRSLDIEYSGELVFNNIDERGAINQHPKALREAFSIGQNLVPNEINK